LHPTSFTRKMRLKRRTTGDADRSAPPPEDTMRFYSLRLHEKGVIKSSPQKILAQGTDWRFLNELKKG